MVEEVYEVTFKPATKRCKDWGYDRIKVEYIRNPLGDAIRMFYYCSDKYEHLYRITKA